MAAAATFALDSTGLIYVNLNTVPALTVQGSSTTWRIATAQSGGATFSTVYASKALALAAIVTYVGTAVVL
ncbi:MAG TPA: hypothetical protein VHX38_18900 [Pseudonocardiaceae bacterium]|jgi:hypothetical protein|nr:hypothetical protein [Pseudonocardiaceae bacterium]